MLVVGDDLGIATSPSPPRSDLEAYRPGQGQLKDISWGYIPNMYTDSEEIRYVPKGISPPGFSVKEVRR